jgi:hypothetical protein
MQKSPVPVSHSTRDTKNSPPPRAAAGMLSIHTPPPHHICPPLRFSRAPSPGDGMLLTTRTPHTAGGDALTRTRRWPLSPSPPERKCRGAALCAAADMQVRRAGTLSEWSKACTVPDIVCECVAWCCIRTRGPRVSTLHNSTAQSRHRLKQASRALSLACLLPCHNPQRICFISVSSCVSGWLCTTSQPAPPGGDAGCQTKRGDLTRAMRGYGRR